MDLARCLENQVEDPVSGKNIIALGDAALGKKSGRIVKKV